MEAHPTVYGLTKEQLQSRKTSFRACKDMAKKFTLALEGNAVSLAFNSSYSPLVIQKAPADGR